MKYFKENIFKIILIYLKHHRNHFVVSLILNVKTIKQRHHTQIFVNKIFKNPKNY